MDKLLRARMRAEKEDGFPCSVVLGDVNGFLIPKIGMTKTHFITSLFAIDCLILGFTKII
jgi:hypothetical protein